jgi:adenylyltransferase/sulfurtransferase
VETRFDREFDDPTLLVVGAGAIGSAAAAGLAEAGCRRLGIVDPELEERRAERLAGRLGSRHPDLHADPYPALLEAANAEAIVTGHDLVVDCTNDGDARLAANAACLALNVPLVVAGSSGGRASLTAVVPGEGPCWRCAQQADDALRGGERRPAVAAVASAAGSLAALEAIKLLKGTGVSLAGRVLVLDGLEGEAWQVEVERRDDCPVCAAKREGVEAAR